MCGNTGSSNKTLTAEEEANIIEKRGKLVVDAAANEGVTHFIYSCTGDIQRVMQASRHQGLSPGGTLPELSSPSSESGLTASGTVSAHAGYISPTLEHPPLNPPLSILAHASVQKYINEKVKRKSIGSCSTLAIALPFEGFTDSNPHWMNFLRTDGGFYVSTSKRF